MSEAGNAVKNQTAAKTNDPNAGNRVSELKVSGHLMTLDTGIFCIFHAPGGVATDDGSGLPGVRITLPPAPSAQQDLVKITTFRPDGWLDFAEGAALVRVERGPAQVLVTVYQSLGANADTAPRLQVLRLTPDVGAPAQAAVAPGVAAAPPPGSADIVAHIQRVGDVAGQFGAWTGTRGSGSWIEGFVVTPPKGLTPTDLEYQGVLGRGWLSPWIEGGKFCGSRGMALPLLGLNVRLRGEAAKTHECTYFATFVDGTSVGPVPAGEACQADSLAALEAFQIVLRRRGEAAVAAPAAVEPLSRPKAPAPRPAVGRRPPPAPSPKPVVAPVRSAAAAAKPGAGRAKPPAAAGRSTAATSQRNTARAKKRPAPRR